MASKNTRCGGCSHPGKPDSDTELICEKVKPHAELKTGKKFDKFTPVKCSKQVVAGTNHFIKVRVGGDEYVHLRVHEKLPCAGGEIELTAIQEGKSLEDELAYF
ncbi:cystatin-B-like [Brachionichthys hirsutus]|uniref:cystatin-B-like n=1 Tax=Brachionichthys hirsutus TaxID=412623 RepID=UPI00360478E1